jgi:hypothetical protein
MMPPARPSATPMRQAASYFQRWPGPAEKETAEQIKTANHAERLRAQHRIEAQTRERLF